MNADAFPTKRRYLWQPSALRLLRERACVQYARQVVPRVVDGISIQFPETETSLGLRVAVRSRRLQGRALLTMLYEPEMRGMALDWGMIALTALHRADVESPPFTLFSTVYRLVRGPWVALGDMLGSRLLTRDQRREMHRLIAGRLLDRGNRKALVHGDLQASHLIVDLARNSLGFIDLEAMRVGSPATDLAQLWIGFHHADPWLGQRLYERYAEQFPDVLDDQFDADVRAEIALRSYSHIHAGRRSGNVELEDKARVLLASVLSGASFEETCFGRRSRGNSQSIL